MSDTLTRFPLGTLSRDPERHVLHRLFPTVSSHPLSGTVRFGRRLFTDDPAMSTEHAEITVGGHVTVRDLGSKNGTWRHGARLAEAVLDDGDVLRMGDSFFLYRIEPVELDDADVPGLLGVSPAIRGLRAGLAAAAPTRATLMLLGETGTGKTVAARAIHTLSGRRGEFIHVNCAAIPESVAESTLFGHKAGAFTDARTDSPGLFRAAHRGTLFLDEIGLLSPTSQGRLLVAIESGQVTPVGGTTPVPVDVRILVATNDDPRDTSRFRSDLYARLADMTFTFPPLRARREDLLPLFRRWLPSPPFTADAVHLLLNWHWPYNVREVEKLATELRIRTDGLREIGANLLSGRFDPPDPDKPAPAPVALQAPPDRETLISLLRSVGGNVSELARRVGRSTKQIYRWCAALGINPDEYRT